MTKTEEAGDYFENVPDLPSQYPMASAMRWHPLGFLPWAHPVATSIMPHAHVIREAWSPAEKNAMAEHIENFHKPVRR